MAELPYKIVVGLEVHVQLLTKSKLFCGCSTRFGSPPNTQVCPVCLGMPGVLPVMNRNAFELSLRAALALNCSIANFTKWDRKNYYYPDLPKNYQVSQYDLPFSYEGYLEINAAPDPKKGHVPKRIGIIRAHLEEDAGKSMHDESGRGGDSKVDLNRTGTPLLEIVSKPEISTPEEAKDYLEELRLMLREIGVSDCEMQEGSLRCDANVNIHVKQADGTIAATPLVEVKNLNSISSVGRAIAHEAERQYAEFQKDPKNYRIDRISKTTAGWNDARGATVVQRHKEEAADYRYFPEPDLVPVVVGQAELDAAKQAMGELPAQQRKRLEESYTISAYDARVLTTKGRKMVAYFEEVAAQIGDGKQVSNRLSDLVMGALNERKEEIDEFPITAGKFVDFMKKTAGINQQDRRDVFKNMLETGSDTDNSLKTLGIQLPSSFDEAKLRLAVVEAIAANPQALDDFKKGKTAAANRIKGHVMKNQKGAPNDLVQRLLEEELAKL